MQKRDIILFHEKAEEALDIAEEANNGNLQLKNKEERWGVPGERKHSAGNNRGGSTRIPQQMEIKRSQI